MHPSKSRIAYLLEIYSAGRASSEEEQELFDYVSEGDESVVKEHILKIALERGNDQHTPIDWDSVYEKVSEEIYKKNLHPWKQSRYWQKWAAAAAAIILVTSTAIFLLSINGRNKQNTIAVTEKEEADIAAPQSVQAFLTLSDGRKIAVGEVGPGTVAIQGSVGVLKTEKGELVYQGNSSATELNTLNNPNGSPVISLVLADGTRVWLNTGSTITFPTAFSGKERKVHINGEAYFEVAKNTAMPFVVTKGETTVNVLGTHFNVEAYDNERSVKVTLLEGSVRVTSNKMRKSNIIAPGQQATVLQGGNITLNSAVDLEEVMAWKNGFFSYNGVDIETIMRQVARWYDVEVVFTEPVQEKFYAEVSRNTSISTLLKMLAATNAISFRIEGKKILVMAAVK